MEKKRRFVVFDIHGNIKALEQCLERCGFRDDIDQLITIGDITDGWGYVYECVERLLKIQDRIDLMGNHDEWFVEFLDTGFHPDRWRQGGQGTLSSYQRNCLGDKAIINDVKISGIRHNLLNTDVPATHWKFFKHQIHRYVDDQNNCFVHAGFNRDFPLKDQHPSTLMWDRDLMKQALSCTGTQKLKTADNFNKIFIGHTSTEYFGSKVPIIRGGVICGDTGAGYRGALTIMNVDTLEYWQSDTDLYPPEEHGR